MLIGTKSQHNLLVLPPLMLALEICASAELGLRFVRGPSLLQVDVGISLIALRTDIVALSKSSLRTILLYDLSQMLQRL